MSPVAVVSFLCLLAVVQLSGVQGWSQNDRVLLKDIQAITLYSDRYTNARRSSPIPQLKCIGGNAGCSAMTPQVVQCHNRGWDGIDVQWECKVDMDNAYRFGKIEVSCEGFDYPNDPYVLSGSCGLEYTLELTEEGRKRSQNGNSFGGSGYSKSWNSQSPYDGSGVIVFLVLLGLAYGVYKLFLSTPPMQQEQHPPNYDGHDDQHYSHANAPPPPPGFKSDFTGNTSGFGGFSKPSSYGSQATQGPGFWTGLGTGGVLGYLFGNRRSQPHYTASSPYHNTWSAPSFSGSTFSSSQSSGVRTASGFGGTKRR
ncbi:PREDICTED: store-operated calcium entry-associated regulatory factor [Nanorana parkeri]|uniref:store-operated calcium entry-associated regulatory factor n=1 Tax=Nanorana parkeri TaxID=125878 RepID=UPI0008543AED|nr:PREDICTED: store-operated calcium entry-associated regulatory factor [Nanorana parkeri]